MCFGYNCSIVCRHVFHIVPLVMFHLNIKTVGTSCERNSSYSFVPIVLKLCMCFFHGMTLRKQAYSYILKILPPKNENFQIKNSDIFHVSAQNID